MQFQLNTDPQLRAAADLVGRLQQDVEAALARFAPRITRVEVHLNDLNGDKAGLDKRCQLEARVAGRSPVSVRHVAPSVQRAVDGALAKLVAALDHTLGKLDTAHRAGGRIDPTRLNGTGPLPDHDEPGVADGGDQASGEVRDER